MTFLASRSEILGELNYADAAVVGVALTSAILIAIAALLIGWRRFSPDHADLENKQTIILGVRQAIVTYDDTAELSVHQFLERNASFMRVRRHLPEEFLKKLAKKRVAYPKEHPADLHHLLRELQDELDVLAARWGVG